MNGLYHLGNDKCDFKVPGFVCEQRLRIRTKVHEKKNKKGFCKLSVIVACQPKNINNLLNSEYSLDNQVKIPLNLSYDDRTHVKTEIITISDDALDVFIP